MNAPTQPRHDARDLVQQALAIDPQLSINDPDAFIRLRHRLLETLMARSGRNEARLHDLQEQIDHGSAVNPSPRQAIETLMLTMQGKLQLLNQLCRELEGLTEKLRPPQPPPA